MSGLIALVEREWIRFFRQKSRIVGALGTPLLFWFLIGSGIGNSFSSPYIPEGMGYLEYFFPGTVLMLVLFTSVFSTISVIQDRNEGFMQSALVSPISRSYIVGGKILGGVFLSLIQALLLLFVAGFVGFKLSIGVVGLFLLSIAILSICLTAFGFVFAWQLNSIQGFHGVMNLLMFPMWLLSGALFPQSIVPFWLKIMMYVNPLTYGLSLLRNSLYQSKDVSWAGMPGFAISFIICVFFGSLFLVISTRQVSRSA